MYRKIMSQKKNQKVSYDKSNLNMSVKELNAF